MQRSIFQGCVAPGHEQEFSPEAIPIDRLGAWVGLIGTDPRRISGQAISAIMRNKNQ